MKPLVLSCIGSSRVSKLYSDERYRGGDDRINQGIALRARERRVVCHCNKRVSDSK